MATLKLACTCGSVKTVNVRSAKAIQALLEAWDEEHCGVGHQPCKRHEANSKAANDAREAGEEVSYEAN